MFLDTKANFGHDYVPHQPILGNYQDIPLTSHKIPAITCVEDSGEFMSLIDRIYCRDLPSFQVGMYVGIHYQAPQRSVMN